MIDINQDQMDLAEENMVNKKKVKAKYGKLPEAGLQVKIVTNSDGFGKVKLD